MSSRLLRFGILAISSVGLMACAAPVHVNSFAERGADLTSYRSYGFGPAEAVSTGDPRLDNNPFFYDRVQAAVAKDLAAKGYEKTTSGTPDLLIHLHASVTQKIDVDEIDRKYGYCNSADCRPFVYDAGTLLLDFVDARTNKLVWRGWAEGSFDGVVDNQAWMEQRIDDAVSRILGRLPRRS